MWPLFLTEGIYQHTIQMTSYLHNFIFIPMVMTFWFFYYPLFFHKIQKIMLIGNWPIFNPIKLILVAYKPKYPLL